MSREPRGGALDINDHVIRTCKAISLVDGKPSAASFTPREADIVDAALSVHSLAVASPELAVGSLNLDRIKLHVRREAHPLNVKPSHVLAVVPVSLVRGKVITDGGQPLECLHDPMPNDDPHSVVCWYPEDKPTQLAIADFLAEQVIYSESVGRP